MDLRPWPTRRIWHPRSDAQAKGPRRVSPLLLAPANLNPRESCLARVSNLSFRTGWCSCLEDRLTRALADLTGLADRCEPDLREQAPYGPARRLYLSVRSQAVVRAITTYEGGEAGAVHHLEGQDRRGMAGMQPLQLRRGPSLSSWRAGAICPTCRRFISGFSVTYTSGPVRTAPDHFQAFPGRGQRSIQPIRDWPARNDVADSYECYERSPSAQPRLPGSILSHCYRNRHIVVMFAILAQLAPARRQPILG
jgi:hypothetical protein